jgi:hypothetical protein
MEGGHLAHFPSGGPYYLKSLFTPIDSEAPGYDAMIRHGIEHPIEDHAAVDYWLIKGRLPVEKARFIETLNAINARTQDDFFTENARLLTEVVRHCRTRHANPDLACLQGFLRSPTGLQALRRELAIRFNGQYRASRFPTYRLVDKHKTARKMGFPLDHAEEGPDPGSMIDRTPSSIAVAMAFSISSIPPWIAGPARAASQMARWPSEPPCSAAISSIPWGAWPVFRMNPPPVPCITWDIPATPMS